MDFLLKFLILGGKYLTRITAQSIIEAYNRSVQLGNKLNTQYEQALAMTGGYDNMLDLYNSNLESMENDEHLVFLSDKHKEEFEMYLQDIESRRNLAMFDKTNNEDESVSLPGPIKSQEKIVEKSDDVPDVNNLESISYKGETVQNEVIEEKRILKEAQTSRQEPFKYTSILQKVQKEQEQRPNYNLSPKEESTLNTLSSQKAKELTCVPFEKRIHQKSTKKHSKREKSPFKEYKLISYKEPKIFSHSTDTKRPKTGKLILDSPNAVEEVYQSIHNKTRRLMNKSGLIFVKAKPAKKEFVGKKNETKTKEEVVQHKLQFDKIENDMKMREINIEEKHYNEVKHKNQLQFDKLERDLKLMEINLEDKNTTDVINQNRVQFDKMEKNLKMEEETLDEKNYKEVMKKNKMQFDKLENELKMIELNIDQTDILDEFHSKKLHVSDKETKTEDMKERTKTKKHKNDKVDVKLVNQSSVINNVFDDDVVKRYRSIKKDIDLTMNVLCKNYEHFKVIEKRLNDHHLFRRLEMINKDVNEVDKTLKKNLEFYNKMEQKLRAEEYIIKLKSGLTSPLLPVDDKLQDQFLNELNKIEHELAINENRLIESEVLFNRHKKNINSIISKEVDEITTKLSCNIARPIEDKPMRKLENSDSNVLLNQKIVKMMEADAIKDIKKRIEKDTAFVEKSFTEYNKLLRKLTHKLLDTKHKIKSDVNATTLIPLPFEYKMKIDKSDVQNRGQLLNVNKRAFDELESTIKVVKIINKHREPTKKRPLKLPVMNENANSTKSSGSLCKLNLKKISMFRSEPLHRSIQVRNTSSGKLVKESYSAIETNLNTVEKVLENVNSNFAAKKKNVNQLLNHKYKNVPTREKLYNTLGSQSENFKKRRDKVQSQKKSETVEEVKEDDLQVRLTQMSSGYYSDCAILNQKIKPQPVKYNTTKRELSGEITSAKKLSLLKSKIRIRRDLALKTEKTNIPIKNSNLKKMIQNMPTDNMTESDIIKQKTENNIELINRMRCKGKQYTKGSSETSKSKSGINNESLGSQVHELVKSEICEDFKRLTYGIEARVKNEINNNMTAQLLDNEVPELNFKKLDEQLHQEMYENFKQLSNNISFKIKSDIISKLDKKLPTHKSSTMLSPVKINRVDQNLQQLDNKIEAMLMEDFKKLSNSIVKKIKIQLLDSRVNPENEETIIDYKNVEMDKDVERMSENIAKKVKATVLSQVEKPAARGHLNNELKAIHKNIIKDFKKLSAKTSSKLKETKVNETKKTILRKVTAKPKLDDCVKSESNIYSSKSTIIPNQLYEDFKQLSKSAEKHLSYQLGNSFETLNKEKPSEEIFHMKQEEIKDGTYSIFDCPYHEKENIFDFSDVHPSLTKTVKISEKHKAPADAIYEDFKQLSRNLNKRIAQRDLLENRDNTISDSIEKIEDDGFEVLNVKSNPYAHSPTKQLDLVSNEIYNDFKRLSKNLNSKETLIDIHDDTRNSFEIASNNFDLHDNFEEDTEHLLKFEQQELDEAPDVITDKINICSDDVYEDFKLLTKVLNNDLHAQARLENKDFQLFDNLDQISDEVELIEIQPERINPKIDVTSSEIYEDFKKMTNTFGQTNKNFETLDVMDRAEELEHIFEAEKVAEIESRQNEICEDFKWLTNNLSSNVKLNEFNNVSSGSYSDFSKIIDNLVYEDRLNKNNNNNNKKIYDDFKKLTDNLHTKKEIPGNKFGSIKLESDELYEDFKQLSNNLNNKITPGSVAKLDIDNGNMNHPEIRFDTEIDLNEDEINESMTDGDAADDKTNGDKFQMVQSDVYEDFKKLTNNISMQIKSDIISKFTEIEKKMITPNTYINFTEVIEMIKQEMCEDFIKITKDIEKKMNNDNKDEKERENDEMPEKNIKVVMPLETLQANYSEANIGDNLKIKFSDKNGNAKVVRDENAEQMDELTIMESLEGEKPLLMFNVQGINEYALAGSHDSKENNVICSTQSDLKLKKETIRSISQCRSDAALKTRQSKQSVTILSKNIDNKAKDVREISSKYKENIYLPEDRLNPASRTGSKPKLRKHIHSAAESKTVPLFKQLKKLSEKRKKEERPKAQDESKIFISVEGPHRHAFRGVPIEQNIQDESFREVQKLGEKSKVQTELNNFVVETQEDFKGESKKMLNESHKLLVNVQNEPRTFASEEDPKIHNTSVERKIKNETFIELMQLPESKDEVRLKLQEPKTVSVKEPKMRSESIRFKKLLKNRNEEERSKVRDEPKLFDSSEAMKKQVSRTEQKIAEPIILQDNYRSIINRHLKANEGSDENTIVKLSKKKKSAVALRKSNEPSGDKQINKNILSQSIKPDVKSDVKIETGKLLSQDINKKATRICAPKAVPSEQMQSDQFNLSVNFLDFLKRADNEVKQLLNQSVQTEDGNKNKEVYTFSGSNTIKETPLIKEKPQLKKVMSAHVLKSNLNQRDQVVKPKTADIRRGLRRAVEYDENYLLQRKKFTKVGREPALLKKGKSKSSSKSLSSFNGFNGSNNLISNDENTSIDTKVSEVTILQDLNDSSSQASCTMSDILQPTIRTDSEISQNFVELENKTSNQDNKSTIDQSELINHNNYEEMSATESIQDIKVFSNLNMPSTAATSTVTVGTDLNMKESSISMRHQSLPEVKFNSVNRKKFLDIELKKKMATEAKLEGRKLNKLNETKSNYATARNNFSISKSAPESKIAIPEAQPAVADSPVAESETIINTSGKNSESIRNKNPKAIEFSSPVRLLKNSIWNWENQRAMPINPIYLPGKDILQYNKLQPQQSPSKMETAALKSYHYETKCVKSPLGKSLTVTYLVED